MGRVLEGDDLDGEVFLLGDCDCRCLAGERRGELYVRGRDAVEIDCGKATGKGIEVVGVRQVVDSTRMRPDVNCGVSWW